MKTYFSKASFSFFRTVRIILLLKYIFASFPYAGVRVAINMIRGRISFGGKKKGGNFGKNIALNRTTVDTAGESENTVEDGKKTKEQV